MANMLPAFITGANAKITVDGKTFAYASDVSYSVSVDTVPIEVMGKYEAVTNEPVNYTVGGELSVVRYTATATKAGAIGAAANGKGNGLGNVTGNTGVNQSFQMDPGNMLLSSSWNLQVYQKTAPSLGGSADPAALNPNTNITSFITITDCRFNRKSAGINKRGILVDRLGFVGVLASDDSFTSSNSGDQDLS